MGARSDDARWHVVATRTPATLIHPHIVRWPPRFAHRPCSEQMLGLMDIYKLPGDPPRAPLPPFFNEFPPCPSLLLTSVPVLPRASAYVFQTDPVHCRARRRGVHHCRALRISSRAK